MGVLYHSWGKSPKQKAREKEYNHWYYMNITQKKQKRTPLRNNLMPNQVPPALLNQLKDPYYHSVDAATHGPDPSQDWREDNPKFKTFTDTQSKELYKRYITGRKLARKIIESTNNLQSYDKLKSAAFMVDSIADGIPFQYRQLSSRYKLW